MERKQSRKGLVCCMSLASSNECNDKDAGNKNIQDVTGWLLIKGWTEDDKTGGFFIDKSQDINKYTPEQINFLKWNVCMLNDPKIRQQLLNKYKLEIDQNEDSSMVSNQVSYFLPELQNDINVLSEKINEKHNHNLLKVIDCKKALKMNDALNKLQEQIKTTYNEAVYKHYKRFVVYYTGHGECKTGDWIICGKEQKMDEQKINDQKAQLKTMKVKEFRKCFGDEKQIQIIVLCDCCYSCEWVKQLDRTPYLIYAATSMYGASPSSPDNSSKNNYEPIEGYSLDGIFRLWMCGKKGVYLSKYQESTTEIFASETNGENKFYEKLNDSIVDENKDKTLNFNDTIAKFSDD